MKGEGSDDTAADHHALGRRPAKLCLVKGQMEWADVKPGRAVDKWRVFRDACEAREKLGLQDRALAVLNALMSFYPEQGLTDDLAMVIFPSNAQLSIRAHGISGSTLRRSLAALVEAAFGFSFAPLLIR